MRQLASVLLKQYIDVHWSPDAARCARRKKSASPENVIFRFRPPEAPQATKAAIRAMLPHGLKESISKVKGFFTRLESDLRITSGAQHSGILPRSHRTLGLA